MIYGAKYVCAAPMVAEPTTGSPTYGDGFNIGALNEVAENLTFSTIKGYGDNRATHVRTDFTGGTVDVRTTDLPLAVQAKLYGAQLAEGNQLKYNTTDKSPTLGLAYYISMQMPDTGEDFCEVHFFPKVSAVRQNVSATTVAENATYNYHQLQFGVERPKGTTYEQVYTFASEAEAEACIDTLLNVAEGYKVSIASIGSGTVDPSGMVFAAAGTNVILTLTGTVSALYDNGVESKSSIDEDKYTLSSIAADHVIWVVFGA